MADLIDRQKTIDAILKETAYQNVRDLYEYAEDHGNEWCGGIVDAIDAVIAVPSAEPEIIHCKDCKYYGRADKRRFYRGMDCLNKHIDTIVPDVDFCSKAERREDG